MPGCNGSLDRQLAGRPRGPSPSSRILPIGFQPWRVGRLGAGRTCWPGRRSVGAPPDAFNAEGQDWRPAAVRAGRLRAAAYGPFIQTIRAVLRTAGGLRIDHVMGLFRLWWIPEGQHPRNGWYVRYPADDLLGIVGPGKPSRGGLDRGRGPGHGRAGRPRAAGPAAGALLPAVVVRGPRPPADIRELSMAAVTTHDLPTIAGLWSGADEAAQRAIGLTVGDEMRSSASISARCSAWKRRTPVDEVIEAGLSPPGRGPVADRHRHAGRRPGDGASGPNMPGTIEPMAQLVAGPAAGHRDDGRGRIAAADRGGPGKGRGLTARAQPSGRRT